MLLSSVRESTPLKRKLAWGFGLQFAMTATCALAVYLVGAGLPPIAGEVMSAVAVLVAGAVAALVPQAIAAPFGALLARIESLAAGDIQSDVPSVEPGNCMAQLAKATLTLRDAATKSRGDREEAEARRSGDEAKAAREAEAGRAQLDRVTIDSLGAGLARLARGDLAHRIDTPFTPETDSLRTEFNALVEKLRQTITTIGANTQAISSGTGEISTAADDLSRRTEQQAASLEETAASLDEITATVKKTAEGAKHTREIVSAAKADAEKSGEVVRQAIEAMSGIEKSSRQIGQIIGVIDEIAFQTNLLALNAGVEAARAGDAGRGFAVVASEVRALAQRSAEAAREIKDLISTSTAQVDRGVDLVAETGKALERIVVQVADITGEVTAIATSAHEQATGLHQINTAVNQMDQVTQQNAAMVEQTTAAAHSLAQETAELARLVGTFDTGERRAVERPRAAPSPAPVRRAPPKPVSRGPVAAVRKAEPATTTQNWEEF
jgi:methyl-accepting chemotaxis protein